jgi:hypothetical protein
MAAGRASKSCETRPTVKAPAWSIAVTVAFGAAGCSDSGGAQSAADCAAQVRADGIVYTSHGYTERGATEHSSAEEAVCEDVGPDAAGSVFPAAPSLVTTWTFKGFPAAKVLGVRSGDTSTFAVFVADSVPAQERDRIYQHLAGGGG